MCDYRARTRSWFMVGEPDQDTAAGTRLYFGSAVVPIDNKETGEPELGRSFSLLLSFHRVYSVLLLRAAERRVRKHGNRAAARLPPD
jgi:hypothetical protein